MQEVTSNMLFAQSVREIIETYFRKTDTNYLIFGGFVRDNEMLKLSKEAEFEYLAEFVKKKCPLK